MSRMDEIKERLSNATPGPWLHTDYSVKTREDANYGYPPEDGMICGLYDGEYIENPNTKNDAKFIAHAPADIEYLLARVEKLETALKKVYEMDGYMFVKEALKEPTPE